MRLPWKGGLLIMAIVANMGGGASAADGWKTQKGTYAVFDTTLGKIVCKLFPDKAPVTVENFTGLAEGTKEYTDPKTHKKAKGAYYDGIVFHRVIPGFMIQSGDPLGQGTGGPGYDFEDEFAPGLSFQKPGILAMANRGPGTNGSQFFITVAPTPHLQNRHTIFGEVIEGQDVAVKIANAPRDYNDRPKTSIVINKLTIERVK